jgi:hypothetical protein
MDDKQLQLPPALAAAVDAKFLSLERVPLAPNAHDRRKVLGLGSVSLLHPARRSGLTLAQQYSPDTV